MRDTLNQSSFTMPQAFFGLMQFVGFFWLCLMVRRRRLQ
jgi:hypothetical protein